MEVDGAGQVSNQLTSQSISVAQLAARGAGNVKAMGLTPR